METRERLQSLDEHGERVKIIPAEVRGFWRKHRDWSQVVLILIFLILPWTTMNGKQTLLLHIGRREFTIFGLTFFAHDGPLVFFLLATLTISLAFVTSVWGRIWCGWGCPQTVFIDGVYRRIERWVEGNYLEQMKLYREKLSFRKIRLYTTKWFLFFIVSAVIAHSFMAYFLGAHELLAMMQKPPTDNWFYFVFVFVCTALILFDFAWFREQFCIIMCPYGRFQSVLMDSSTLTIYYDANRGEPRKGKAIEGQNAGDCVSCNRCVQVCPTKIDIRDGAQMECIACTACIDACDEIMEKVKKPKGLIRYASLKGAKIQLLKPRNALYVALLTIVISGLTWIVAHRKPLSYSVIRAVESPYNVVKNDKGEDIVVNHFRLHVKNQTSDDANYQLIAPEVPGLEMTVAQNPVHLTSMQSLMIHIFLKFPKQALTPDPKVFIKIEREGHPDEVYQVPVILVGPNG